MMIREIDDQTITIVLDPTTATLMADALGHACDNATPEQKAAWNGMACALEVAAFAATLINHPRLSDKDADFRLRRFLDGKITVDAA